MRRSFRPVQPITLIWLAIPAVFLALLPTVVGLIVHRQADLEARASSFDDAAVVVPIEGGPVVAPAHP